jgi:hypothetical protein
MIAGQADDRSSSHVRAEHLKQPCPAHIERRYQRNAHQQHYEYGHLFATHRETLPAQM